MCLTPYRLKTDELVPCGKCPACYSRRISSWSFRLMEEDKQSITGYFITLTYDTKYVPITPNGFMGLKGADLQNFFKQLRILHTRSDSEATRELHKEYPIKYYACGEYGSKNRRPHYHIILFNAELKLIAKSWTMGAIHYGTISRASVGYTLKYMSKIKQFKSRHSRDDRPRERSWMSKGLGKSYLSVKMKNWHYNDMENRMYCNIEDGKRIAMPRYYKERIYNKEQREIAAWKAQQKFREAEEKEMQLQGDLYWHNKAAAVEAAFQQIQSQQKLRK